jgi:hypothetical protein
LTTVSAVLLSAPALSAGATHTAATSPSATDAKQAAPSSDEALVAQEKRRLEELFISKMSEELKLPAETKTSFAEAIRALNREKTKANFEVADALIAIDKAQSSDRAKTKKETEIAVKRYEKAWRAYGDVPIREVARMRKILGAEKLGLYLLAKAQMAEKLKAIAARESTESATESTPERTPETKSPNAKP